MVAALKAVSDTRNMRVTAVSVSHQKIVPLANFELTKVRCSPVHHVMAPMSSLLALPSGTTAPTGAYGNQDPCACATNGKLEDVVIFCFQQ